MVKNKLMEKNWKRWMLGGLSKKQWRELVALEYVLTWGYTHNQKRDEKRHKKLSKKLWIGRDAISQTYKQ